LQEKEIIKFLAIYILIITIIFLYIGIKDYGGKIGWHVDERYVEKECR